MGETTVGGDGAVEHHIWGFNRGLVARQQGACSFRALCARGGAKTSTTTGSQALAIDFAIPRVVASRWDALSLSIAMVWHEFIHPNRRRANDFLQGFALPRGAHGDASGAPFSPCRVRDCGAIFAGDVCAEMRRL